MWFFVVMGLAIAVAIVLVIVRTGNKETAPVAVSPWPEAPSPIEEISDSMPTEQASPEPGGADGTPAPTGVTLGASCSYDREGYGIDYPDGWFTPSDRAWVCQLFDPTPFVVQPDTEPPIVAVSVYVENYRLSKVAAALSDPTFYTVVSSDQGTFADAGRPGTILETKATSQGLWPKGTRTFSVLVDRVDSTVVVSTNDLAASDYEQNKLTVLAMGESLRIAGQGT